MVAFKIPLPEKTNTYSPVGHRELCDIIEKNLDKHVSQDFTPTFRSKSYGQILTGTYAIGHGEFKQSLSFVNSYNKKTRVGIATGTTTSVCDNGCLFGEYKFLRKHTGNIQDELEGLIVERIKKLQESYEKNLEWFEKLKVVNLTKREMSELAGRIFIDADILKATQLSVLKKEIIEPSFDYGGNNDTLYEFYQHVTHAIKNVHPVELFKTHRTLIDFTENERLVLV